MAKLACFLYGLIFCFIGLLLNLTLQKVVKAEDQKLLFYLSFDKSLANDVTGVFGEAQNVNLTQGKVGQGAYFPKGSFLRFPTKDNIDYRSGTLELWFKPDWYGNDNGDHHFFAGNIDDSKAANSLQLSKRHYEDGVVLGQTYGKVDEKGYPIEEASVPWGRDFSSVSVAHWKPGEWHYLVFSWYGQKKILKLYIDGLLVAVNNKLPENALPSSQQTYINIGSTIERDLFAEGVIDELKIWNYPKSDIEIARQAGLVVIDKNKTSFDIFGWLKNIFAKVRKLL